MTTHSFCSLQSDMKSSIWCTGPLLASCMSIKVVVPNNFSIRRPSHSQSASSTLKHISCMQIIQDSIQCVY
ncbi:hypothetical protein V5799_012872 [Amblyomma americanum]|uniref:Uncharacterized protein n=1 Tax=Amblyomma americanum TaxID=6943 RepID=A0AAQ4E7L7_AMBAM